MYYLVLDSWNCVVARFDNEIQAKTCARAKGGIVVYIRARPKF